ncbi:formate dehydrogenase, partial [Mesorhizobium sp.]
GGASTTAAVAAVTLSPGEAQAYDPGEEETRARYRETEHVKAFYRVNGYETLKK